MSTTDLIRGRLDAARRDLLDLTARNRLLNTPRHRSRSRSVEVVDERSEDVFRILVRDGKAMSFLAGRDTEEEHDDLWLPQPEESSERHTDLRLQTRLASDSLQKRLLSIYYDARTFEEEQGVSILFLAMGFLKWFESPASEKERHAPLLLIPVEMERQSAGSRFRLHFLDEDVTTNLSLQAKLKADFGIQLPDVPDLDDLSPEGYFEAVEQVIGSQPRWEVLRNDVQLGFFSFAKFLMYRDLDPEIWADGCALDKHPLITGLLDGGFGEEPPICGEEDWIDELISPRDTFHVMDVDSSQALAIEEVRRSRSLVIQGPPGTGKSQTIANLIATAAKEGKRVLFVAEKMAALEVVKSRLDGVDLGDLCLEHLRSPNSALARRLRADTSRRLLRGIGAERAVSPWHQFLCRS